VTLRSAEWDEACHSAQLDDLPDGDLAGLLQRLADHHVVLVGGVTVRREVVGLL
jgi:hypothetical protein